MSQNSVVYFPYHYLPAQNHTDSGMEKKICSDKIPDIISPLTSRFMKTKHGGPTQVITIKF